MTSAGFVGPSSQEPDIVLRLTGARTFRLETPFRYQDTELGTITVPADIEGFTTDLASVPWVSAWYISPLGLHLAAAVLHDALTCDTQNPTYRTRDGVTASPEQADRIFLDAMAASGTPLLRRYVMWSAVRLKSAAGPRPWRWYLWYLLAATLALVLAIAVLGHPGWIPLSAFLDRPFLYAWVLAGLLEFAVMALIGPILFGSRCVKATTIQAALYGLTFLPLVLMLPTAMLFLGRGSLTTRWPD